MAERGKIFDVAPIVAPNRSWFDMSYENTFSFNIGECPPCAFYECLPGDHIKARTGSITRFAPMLSPVMSSINQFSYHFFVRMRDIWLNWEKFITDNDQKRTWQQNTTFVAPTMPYINPRKLMYRSQSNGGLGAAPLFSIFDSNYKYQDAEPAGYDLIIRMRSGEYDDFGRPYDVICNSGNNTVPIDTSTGDQYFIIKFKPNLNDYKYDESSQSRTGRWRLNPFCDGSLMDYLGCDISGMLKNQLSWFDRAFYDGGFTTNNSMISDLCRSYIVTYFEPDSNPTTVNEYFHNTYIPFKFPVDAQGLTDITPFFDTHIVYRIDWIYETQSQNCVSISADGTYTTKTVTSPTSIPNNVPVFSEVECANISMLPVRAYRFIYDEYFRDQNYIEVNPITDFSRDGYEFAQVDFTDYVQRNNVIDYLSVFRKAWEHDIFTTALPGPQRGDAIRFLPDATASISLNGGSNSNSGNSLALTTDGAIVAHGAGIGAASRPTYGIDVDLSAATVERLRWANSMQRYSERKARTGGRYYEWIIGVWNKYVEDAKLNRPIYLDGQRTPVQISEVLQTSATDFSTDQALGDMAGRGIALGKDKYIDFECPDYGFFIELTAVVPRVVYQQGLAPHFQRENYLDFPLPDFAQLGEEYVKNKDLYYSCDDSVDDGAFGYQSRYANFKYKRSEVHGDFKNSLDFWTFARKFENLPVNGKKFIEVDSDYRQFAVTSRNYQHIRCQMWHDVQINRALPEFGVPVL